MKKIITAAAIAGALTMGATTASAQAAYLPELNTAIGSNYTDCLACHSTAGGGTDNGVTPLAASWKTIAGSPAALPLSTTQQTSLANADSDGDGVSNAQEILDGTDPNVDPNAVVASSSGGGGCVTSAATTPLMMVLAMLTLGFFVRRKKD